MLKNSNGYSYMKMSFKPCKKTTYDLGKYLYYTIN